MKKGDLVQVTRRGAPQFGQIGTVIGMRVEGEWWVELEEDMTMSWHESSLAVVPENPEHQLGEDYYLG